MENGVFFNGGLITNFSIDYCGILFRIGRVVLSGIVYDEKICVVDAIG